jgi:hypothetical protein
MRREDSISFLKGTFSVIKIVPTAETKITSIKLSLKLKRETHQAMMKYQEKF